MVCVAQDKWCQTGCHFAPLLPQHLAIFADIYGCQSRSVTTRVRILLSSSGYSPRILLNILQCTVQIPTTKNYLAANINGGTVEKPYPRVTWLPKEVCKWRVLRKLISSLYMDCSLTLICYECDWGQSIILVVPFSLFFHYYPSLIRERRVTFSLHKRKVCLPVAAFIFSSEDQEFSREDCVRSCWSKVSGSN